MNIKLAIKNIRKSFKDYTIYFFTLVLGVTIFYMFNSIYAQKELMSFSEIMSEKVELIEEMLNGLSVFIAVILGFLVVYTNNFFIKRRKKELGLYMLLGMTKNKISRIFVLETSFVAIIALFVGIIFGVIGSQFMSVFTAKLFEADMTQYKFIFASESVIKTILYFSIIFIIVVIFNIFNINRCKLIDLIYSYRKNEELKLKNKYLSYILFFISIACLIVAYYFITINGLNKIDFYFKSSIILGIIGTVLFFFSIAILLVGLIQNSKKIYFKGLNIFILRQLSSKINTNFISMSIICLMLFFVIGVTSSAFGLQEALSNMLVNNTKYNITLSRFGDYEDISQIYNKLPDNIKNFKGIESYVEYSIYSDENLKIEDFNLNLDERLEYFNKYKLNLIKLSDFNNILNQLNLQPYALEENEYLIVSSTQNILKELSSIIANNNSILNINNNELSLKEVVEDICLFNDNYDNYFIVNDDLLKDFEIDVTQLNIMTKTEEDEIVLTKLISEYGQIFKDKGSLEDCAFTNYGAKKNIYESAVSTKAMLSFVGIYIGLVFIISCSTILAIQQISEAEDNKYRYNLLSKLGAEKKVLNRALFIQILFYFLVPLLLAILHSIVGLNTVIKCIEFTADINIFSNTIFTALSILIIYGIYFILTYISSKNIINKG